MAPGNLGVALGNLGVALRKFILKRLIEGEKGVVLKVGETGAYHLTPLHAPVRVVAPLIGALLTI